MPQHPTRLVWNSPKPVCQAQGTDLTSASNSSPILHHRYMQTWCGTSFPPHMTRSVQATSASVRAHSRIGSAHTQCMHDSRRNIRIIVGLFWTNLKTNRQRARSAGAGTAEALQSSRPVGSGRTRVANPSLDPS